MNNLTFRKNNGAIAVAFGGLVLLIIKNVFYFSDSTNNTSNFLTDSYYLTVGSISIILLLLALYLWSQIVILDFDTKVLVIKNRYTRKRREIPFISFTDKWAKAGINGGFFIYASTIEKKKIYLFFQYDTDYYRLLRECLEKETGRLFPINISKSIK